MNNELIVRKLLFVLIVYGVLNTGVYLLLAPEVFEDTIYVIYLAIYYLAGIVDTIIRPIDLERSEEGGYLKYIGLLFLLAPFIFILAIAEQQAFYPKSEILSIIGLVIYLISSAFVILVRIQLGKQATGTLVILEDHELITSGVYEIIRHPMYGGALIGLLGFILVVQGYIVGISTYILYFVIMRGRAIYEEGLLLDKFGEQYQIYMGQVKRFLPFIY